MCIECLKTWKETWATWMLEYCLTRLRVAADVSGSIQLCSTLDITLFGQTEGPCRCVREYSTLPYPWHHTVWPDWGFLPMFKGVFNSAVTLTSHSLARLRATADKIPSPLPQGPPRNIPNVYAVHSYVSQSGL